MVEEPEVYKEIVTVCKPLNDKYTVGEIGLAYLELGLAFVENHVEKGCFQGSWQMLARTKLIVNDLFVELEKIKRSQKRQCCPDHEQSEQD
ncbi:MAG: hypothetical protein Q8O88_00795 [bacterium]|nr:hypothetical protein [bacterium]